MVTLFIQLEVRAYLFCFFFFPLCIAERDHLVFFFFFFFFFLWKLWLQLLDFYQLFGSVWTCGDEQLNTSPLTILFITPIWVWHQWKQWKDFFFFIQLNGQQGQNYTQGDRCASCTLHMRNRNRSMQKLVKLSYGRHHLVSQCSGPNVIWCQLDAMPRWNHMRWHLWIAYNPFPVLLDMFNHTWVIWTTVHTTYCTFMLQRQCINTMNLLNIKLCACCTLLIFYASHVNSSRIILFLKTLPVRAWACICHRWRDTSVGTTVGKMFPWDAHYEWV